MKKQREAAIYWRVSLDIRRLLKPPLEVESTLNFCDNNLADKTQWFITKLAELRALNNARKRTV